tara:strand:+ start:2254 stop:2757 length:504 start_codon:yes stop_codon:yes gene_type:complete
MTLTEAKRIGSRQGLISVGLGLLIAQLIMTLMISTDEGFVKGFFWFTDIDYWINILIGAIIMLACGHFYGQLAGKLILIRKWNFVLTGFLIGLAAILTTTFFASWTGFIQEGIDNIGTNDDPFFDYIFKPMYWVTMFGLIPALIIGAWFGGRIKKKGKEKHGTQQGV